MESQKGSEGVRQEDRDTESIFFCKMRNNKRKKERKNREERETEREKENEKGRE